MDSFIHLLDVFNKYSSLILVLATIVYVGFTIVLAKETKKLREVETNPFISLNFDTFHGGGRLKLIIKNIGKAPAYNISFDMEDRFRSCFDYNFKNKISYFAPNQQITIIAPTYEALQSLNVENIPIKMTYSSKEGLQINDNFFLEWDYLNHTLLGTDTFEGIKKALDGIQKEISNLTKVAKDKNCFVTNKLMILELAKEDEYTQFIFSNGYIGRIANSDISKIGITDIKNIYRDDGDILDTSTNMKFLAEEIYQKFTEINEQEV